MEHHTKQKGDLGVLKAQVDLHQKGYMILIPHTEHAAFDLVIYKNQEFKRVQVKYRELNRNGVLEVRFRSSYCNSKGVVTKETNKQEIDVYCIYCPNTDECYYFDPQKGNKSLTLRVDTPKNQQVQNVHLANDYRDLP
ncbi:group I intron-associated PD-(D/E)XK endonuclease [Bacillus sp. JJ1566]|uniref:group I intron-associated PD-(D/E)XK endonuclease n=1 Tax=Bacillus sp. JJ1566 TaxID=3122961 RepID=UPI003000D2FC